MNNFDFYNPVRVHFGPGRFAEAGKIASAMGRRLCIVSYAELGPLSELCDRLEKLLRDSDLTVFRFCRAEQNPDISTIAEGAEFCRDNSIDCIIGLGGGSAMDAAKAIAAGVVYDGDLWNMVYSRHDDVSALPPSEALPTLMIPTLPATGSEMNQCSVVSSRRLKEKSYIWAECLYPAAAIIDPELTVSLPAYQTACAAADTISHVLEIYINGEEDSPLQHAFQEGVMRTVIGNLPKVLDNPADIEARANLQWAATCAINGWASPGDAWTPIHQVGHNLTSLFGIAHGASLSALMPAWMKSFYSRREKRYLDFAVNVMGVQPGGRDDSALIAEGIERFESFLGGCGVPTTLGELGIESGSIGAIIDGVRKVSFNDEGVLHCNPPVSGDDLEMMLRAARPLEGC